MTGPASTPDESVDSRSRYVAFGDVLGFRELVRLNSHEYVLGLYRGAVELAATYGAAGGRMAPAEDGGWRPDIAMSTVNTRLISDSVLFWTDSERSSEFVALLQNVRAMLASALSTGIPMRVAIGWGELSHWAGVRNQRVAVESLVGLPFVEAYEAEGAQEWSGGLVLDAALGRYDETRTPGAPTVDDLERARWIRRWAIPLKPNRTVTARYALDWTSVPGLQASLGAVAHAFSDHSKPVDSPDVRRKIDNTVAFMK